MPRDCGRDFHLLAAAAALDASLSSLVVSLPFFSLGRTRDLALHPSRYRLTALESLILLCRCQSTEVDHA